MIPLNIKTPLVFRLGVVLLCTMLVTANMMSGLYARYSSTATNEASAQIAKFDVRVTGNGASNVSVDVSQASDTVYAFTIENDSDVAVQYNLSVSPIDVLGVSAVFDNNSGTLEFGGASVVRNLTFEVDWDKFTAGVTGSAHSVNVAFTVTVDIKQID